MLWEFYLVVLTMAPKQTSAEPCVVGACNMSPDYYELDSSAAVHFLCCLCAAVRGKAGVEYQT